MDYVTSGSDYLAKFPDFELVGRKDCLSRLSSILIRHKTNSVILSGPAGAGREDICKGFQVYKNSKDAPIDISSKRMFWLNTDILFASGNSAEINGEFQKVIARLSRLMDAILIIENARDFIESCRNTGTMNFVNALTSAIQEKQFQIILQTDEGDLDVIFKTINDFGDLFTLLTIDEPASTELTSIVSNAAACLSKHHGIKVSDDAVATAIELTTKYETKDASLNRAQPECSVTLLDRTISTLKLGISNETLRKLRQEMRDSEDAVTRKEDALYQQLEKDKNKVSGNQNNFDGPTALGGLDSPEVCKLKQDITLYQKEVSKIKAEYKKLNTELNSHIIVERHSVLSEFSNISGISTSKLNQNELEKLKGLEDKIKLRVFGQDRAVNKLVNAIKVARVGRRNNGRPQASFMFLGPSGTGKTLIAKVLAANLLDDEAALTRFDMSEYAEKHAVAKMIGAPPGYEGFEAGGTLTNLMRKNNNRILLFDEIEKAHPDLFDIFLQVLSDGRLTDNVGRTVSFENAIILMTTNIGQPHFLNNELTEAEADSLAMDDLGSTYKSEFLNRFAGRQNIISFRKLGMEQIVKIVRCEIDHIAKAYADRNVQIRMSESDIQRLANEQYDPKIGARGLPGFIETNIEPLLVNKFIDEPDLKGEIMISYNNNAITIA